jgi:aspartate ammonia-lyase
MSEDATAAPKLNGVLYGKQTQLSLQSFTRKARRLRDIPAFVRNYALVKRAAAQANLTLGRLDEQRALAIIDACDEIADGSHLEQFPTALLLGGGGTTSNMNLNEVIASRASQIGQIAVHPNDHANASQSTNDTFPTAMALTLMDLAQAPLDALHELTESLCTKAKEYADTPYLGRTCLQDAVTVYAGQTLRGQARAVRRATEQLRDAVSDLAAVPLGATVVGTGIGAPEGFADRCVQELRRLTSRNVTVSVDFFDTLAHLDPYSAIADASSRAAITIAKIASDIRLRSSGPRGGLAEVTLPKLQAGSSIMPGKVNPVVPEYAMQLSYRIRGKAYTVACAVAAGELELNVMEPVIVDSLIDIFEDLENAAHAMATLCVSGLEWNGVRRQESLNHAVDRWIDFAAASGYDEATRQAGS